MVFDQFIENMELIDILMIRMRYTSYNSNGFDHCALILKHNTIDWGPKFFRTLDVWNNHVGLRNGEEMLKEKLKKLKRDLKVWNKEVLYYINRTKNIIILGISQLDREKRRNMLGKLKYTTISTRDPTQTKG